MFNLFVPKRRRAYIAIGQSRNGRDRRDRIRESPVDFNRVGKYLKNITDQ